MGFIRFIVASLIAYFVARAIQSAVSGARTAPVRRAPDAPLAPRRKMVSCASCGVYVLEERALVVARPNVFACSPGCVPAAR